MTSGSPQDLDYFLTFLSTSDVRLKVNIGSRLIAYLDDTYNSIECSDIGIFIDEIIQWLSSNIPRVAQHGIEIITHLITRMRRDFRPFVSNVLPVVVNRLGDNNKELRNKAHCLLAKLMECDTISPRSLFDKITTYAFKHKNSNVKEGTMKLLVSTVEEFGSHTITIWKIVPMIVKLLSDSNIPLRHKAIETLVDLYKYIGEKFRNDLQKKCIIPQNILKDLIGKMDRVRPVHSNDPPLPPTRNIGLKPYLNPIAVDENTFIQSFEDVPVVHISNLRDLNETMKKLHASIKDCNGPWRERVESLKKIRSLVLTGAMKYEEFFNNLKYIHSFQIAIKDLRSQVVRETCITIAFLSQNLGINFKLFAESIFIDLIELIQNSAKIFASCGLVTAKFILEYTQSPRIIHTVVLNLESKSKDIRRACCEFINQIMCTWPTKLLKSHVIILQKAIKKGISDADSEARVLSRKAYWGFCEHFPEEGEILLNNLDPTYRKLLLINTRSNSFTSKPSATDNIKLPSRSEFTRQRSRSVIDLRSFQRTRARVINNRSNGNLNHPVRNGRPRKRDSVSQPSSRTGSPSSSIGSLESSVSSINQPLDSVNWNVPQQQYPKDILQIIMDIDDIISNCESVDWNNRREGLENLSKYLHQGSILSEELLKRITDIFSKMLMDSQTKDIILFLDVLNDLIDTHSQYLEYWLYDILSKLFYKAGSDILGSVQSIILKAMEKIKLSFPYDSQLTAVFQFLTDPAQTPNAKMKIYAMNYISKLTDTIDRGSIIGNTEIDGRKDYADLALKKLTEWSLSDKLNQTPEVCKAIDEALTALHNLNSSEVASRLFQLPNAFQESECLNHRMRKMSADQLITPKSPKTITRKLNENMLQSERIGRSKLRIPSSQPSSRPGSPPYSRRGLSGIPRSRDVSREVSPNRYSSRGSQSTSKRPPHLPTSKQILSQKILTQSQEAEFALANALCSTSSRRAYDLNDEDLMSDLYSEFSMSSQLEPSDYLSVLKQTTDEMCNITKYLESDYTAVERVSPSREIDKATRNEMIKILDNLANDTLSLDNKQSNLNRLNEIIQKIACIELLNNLQQIIDVVLKLFVDNEPTTREQAIRWITYLVQKPDLVTFFFSITELIILKVLEMCNDRCQSVVKAAEECAYVLNAALQPDTVVKVITPLISAKKFPINLLAIRMITKLVDKNGSYPVVAQMKEIMPSLLLAYDDRDSTVRKSAVFCLVALYKVLDKQEFEDYVSSLNGTKLKLLDLYIERTQQSSPTYSEINN